MGSIAIQSPQGQSFTLWINRQTGLLNRIEGSGTKQLSDYRRVSGVLLPFVEKKTAGNGVLAVTFTSRTLRKHLDTAAFVIPFRKDYQMPASGEETVSGRGRFDLPSEHQWQGAVRSSVSIPARSISCRKPSLVRLGLKLDSQGVEVGTSSPATIQVHKAHIDTLRIGDIVVRDQTFEVAAIPDDGDGSSPDFAVGYEVMRRFVSASTMSISP